MVLEHSLLNLEPPEPLLFSSLYRQRGVSSVGHLINLIGQPDLIYSQPQVRLIPIYARARVRFRWYRGSIRLFWHILGFR